MNNRIASALSLAAIACMMFASCSKKSTPPTSAPPIVHDSSVSVALVGIVTDSAGRGPIYTVAVRVSSSKSDTSVLSDGKGIFRCTLNAKGTYTISAQKAGYAPLSSSITVGSEKADTVRLHLNLAPSDIPTADLVSDISFKDTTVDRFGNGFIFYGPKYQMEGRIDGDTSARIFEGDNYGILDLPLPFSPNFTACVWFNDYGHDIAGDIGLVLENSLHEDGLQLTIQQRKPIAIVRTDSTTAVVSGPIVRDQQWHFIAAVMQEVSGGHIQIHLFVDGAFAAIGTMDNPDAYGNMVKFTNRFYIGGIGDPASNTNEWPLRGMLDGIRLYNRTLSEAELLKLYHEKGL